MRSSSNGTADQAARIRLKEDRAIYRAFGILEKRLRADRVPLGSPGTVRDFLRVAYANEDREVFAALWLDAQNYLIEFEAMFFGTLTQTSVYPREIVRAAIRHNAAAVIMVHNHPSGIPEPSKSDQTLTHTLKQTLALIDVRVLDHFIVGERGVLSMAERGMV